VEPFQYHVFVCTQEKPEGLQQLQWGGARGPAYRGRFPWYTPCTSAGSSRVVRGRLRPDEPHHNGSSEVRARGYSLLRRV